MVAASTQEGAAITGDGDRRHAAAETVPGIRTLPGGRRAGGRIAALGGGLPAGRAGTAVKAGIAGKIVLRLLAA